LWPTSQSGGWPLSSAAARAIAREEFLSGNCTELQRS
jgi:hypothetical protein